MSGLSQQVKIGVVGAGAMGAGIAQIAADYGHSVRLFDTDASATERGLGNIQDGLTKLVERGRKSAEEVQRLVQRIQTCESLSTLSNCGIVIEAVSEDLLTKQQLFQQLESICPEDTILASNTSSISITALAAKLQRPERFVGMHFFNPAPVMKLVEVISGLATDAKYRGDDIRYGS